jgi:hypothetical protein
VEGALSRRKSTPVRLVTASRCPRRTKHRIVPLESCRHSPLSLGRSTASAALASRAHQACQVDQKVTDPLECSVPFCRNEKQTSVLKCEG